MVGSVDWSGTCPALTKNNDGIAPDPLVVFSVEEALAILEREDDENDVAVIVAPDDLHKADISGGSPYQIGPQAAADGRLLNERHNLHFVDYLRLVFRFGGFPGYDGIDDIPHQIAALKEGLLSF